MFSYSPMVKVHVFNVCDQTDKTVLGQLTISRKVMTIEIRRTHLTCSSVYMIVISDVFDN